MIKKIKVRMEWEERFLEKIKCCHKRNLQKIVKKILKRIDTARHGLVSRSKKYGVECSVTVEELRELVYNAYGTKCKYCDKILVVNNFVIDHIHPISKLGNSNIDNLQIICKTSNSMKGSLEESNFKILLEWLDSVSPELKKDISIRLSRGIH